MSSSYNGLEFKTRLEARWAAFFDLAGWSYWTNPIAVGDWRPDFKVTFRCGHSECDESHTLLATVLPVHDLADFKNHPCANNAYMVRSQDGDWLADGGAAFGLSPKVTQWEISHGAGGGIENIYYRVDDADALWARTDGLVK